MKIKPIEHKIDGLFVLLSFALFAGSLLLVLLMGAGTYQRLQERDARSFENTICLQYVAGKLRHADARGVVQVSSFSSPTDPTADDISTLYLSQIIDGEQYYTRIYWYEGGVRELFSDAAIALRPEDGNLILQNDGMDFCLENSILRLSLPADEVGGQTQSLAVYVRSTGEVGA